MPPQHPDEIVALMANLERFINDDDFSDLDPLTKMAIIHHCLGLLVKHKIGRDNYYLNKYGFL